MKPTALVIVALAVGVLSLAAAPSRAEEPSTRSPAMIKVTSPVFSEGSMIPAKYTADGADVNPPLLMENVPENARSLVLIMEDPDAPVGTWTHWLVWNISPKTREIAENRVPDKAFLGTNDFGRKPYGGPAPPSGTHRYFFRVYALDVVLNLPAGARRNGLEQAMRGHLVAEGALMGKYSRRR